LVNGRKESKHYYDLVQMNVSHYSGGGGGDNEDAADDNGAEGKRMLISKLSRRHMIPRYTTLAVKKSSLNN